MAYEVTLNFPMNQDHSLDRRAIAVDARELLGFAHALRRFDAERCADQIRKLMDDAYHLLDALAEAKDGQEIVGYVWPEDSWLAVYAETVRLLTEAEAKHECVGRQSVDVFAIGLFKEIERQAETESASPRGEADDEAKEEAPVIP